MLLDCLINPLFTQLLLLTLQVVVVVFVFGLASLHVSSQELLVTVTIIWALSGKTLR